MSDEDRTEPDAVGPDAVGPAADPPLGLDPDAAIQGRIGATREAREARDGRQAQDVPRAKDVTPEDPGASEETPEEQEAREAREARAARLLRPVSVIDTGRYQRMIGGFGLLLVVAFSIYLFAKGGSGTPGVGAGQRLPRFVAPLALSDLNATANAHPVCNRARPAKRGLNVCGRRATVLTFVPLGDKPCVQEVNVLQQLAPRFPKVQFAAVAVYAGRQATAKVVRQHGWTIPIGYDQSGAVAEVYGVEVCPLIEIARGNGIIARRLIGKDWLSATKLAGVITKLGI